MAVFAIKAAGRAALRRSHLQNPKTNVTKRQNTSGRPRSKPEDDPAGGTSIPVPNTVPTLPIWQRLGPLSSGFRAYGRSQRNRPYTTQFVSSLVVFFLGDLSAQSINGDEYDPARTGRALIIGGMSSIPSYKWSVEAPPRLRIILTYFQVHVPGK
jgi:protein Mpv17